MQKSKFWLGVNMGTGKPTNPVTQTEQNWNLPKPKPKQLWVQPRSFTLKRTVQKKTHSPVRPLYLTVRFASDSKTHLCIFVRKNPLVTPFLVSFSFKTPRLMIKNISSSSLTQQNNIKNSPPIIKIHNSPLMTHFLQNSLKQQQLNHNFTNDNTKGINYHQQHNIASIKR